MMEEVEERYGSCWAFAPDSFLLQVFGYLGSCDLLTAGLTCRTWSRVSYDEMLWKHLFLRDHGLDSSTPMAPGKTSWYEEYKRLHYHTPVVCCEVLNHHRHEVLHVSFSHDGTMFATSSKDGFIRVWQATYPVEMKYSYDMKAFSWKCTQFSQFNKSDTLLLVSGVHFGTPNTTSGEIAVFSLQGGFNLQCRVGNKPYDIFGTWYSDRHLLSGDLCWLAHLVSSTGLWINKASQETDSEHTPILNQLFRFYNTNASSVRAVMVADCLEGSKLSSSTEPVASYDEMDNASSEGACYSRVCQGDSYEESDSEEVDEDLMGQPEKILIFTTGSKTYIPHQIGFKKIKQVKFPKVLKRGPSLRQRLAWRGRGRSNCRSTPEIDWLNFSSVANKFDNVDQVMDLHGHIIGMGLSPDHRYLYVNSRPWPSGYTITNPLEPPPIAQEIDIHVIDLLNFCENGKMLRSHKAFTPNSECFFIFLDVSDDYVASGAEDKHGYIWDRHYSVCLGKLPHNDVVNSVAFNPTNPEMLVSTSDDYTIKVWRSRSFLDNSLGRTLRSTLTHALPVRSRRPQKDLTPAYTSCCDK
uniref:F-box/WD repeat-containing protein 5 n=1 Tax=Lygus hesperus TaxID=30085 RepID=A0A0A9ZH48_LYGHE